MGRKPKSATNERGDAVRQRRGCNCKRSGCLKNYCECYESKTLCTENCKCLGCRNTEDRHENEANSLDQRQPIKAATENVNSANNKKHNKRLNNVDTAEIEPVETEYETVPNRTIRPSMNLINNDSIKSAINCMLLKAKTCERLQLTPEQTERMILGALGKCLKDMADYSNTKIEGDTILYCPEQIPK